MNPPIELRKTRDFGQIINDSFIFFKENFKSLTISLLIITGLFLLASVISNVLTYVSMSDLYSGSFARSPGFTHYTSSYIINTLINAFIALLTQVFIHLTTVCYISVYLQKGNKQPTFDEVWGYFKYYFLRAVGSGFLIFLLLCVGFVMCFIPGIYLTPILYLIIPIIVIENSSFKYAFNKSFKLIKDNWWFTFGVLFVMGLIVGMAAGIASIPATIISVGSGFLSLKSFTMPVFIICSILRGLIMIAYALPSIAICMSYFTLSEEKEGLGLLSRIENLGKNDNTDTGLPAEEY
ncbi:hypothetical protein HDF18_15055 [Mucilaginibacter sp. X5P1]|uniref:hypothetical protein n=1 Tax=Mucilaginibacter sp. X5P1 TaxID=2723088 RepID=UPI001619A0ED|nr:hypothetical protein [Mucilaginibacter sp. X5P1]MBB6138928.1 hypothetical protein [Mucilaginibacter sp. X5P1]